MAVTLSSDEVFNNESGSDEDGNFIAFIATAVVDESVVVKENPSNRELSKDADLQEACNKIASLELDKKNLLLKLFDVNELLDKVKTKNIDRKSVV